MHAVEGFVSLTAVARYVNAIANDCRHWQFEGLGDRCQFFCRWADMARH